MNSRPNSTRIVAALAAVLTTMLLIGSQLGLADHYNAEAATALAPRQAAQVAQSASATPARRPRT